MYNYTYAKPCSELRSSPVNYLIELTGQPYLYAYLYITWAHVSALIALRKGIGRRWKVKREKEEEKISHFKYMVHI